MYSTIIGQKASYQIIIQISLLRISFISLLGVLQNLLHVVRNKRNSMYIAIRFNCCLEHLGHQFLFEWRIRNITFRFTIGNSTSSFNNISVIWWRSVLLVEETGVPGEKPPTSHK